jgi:MamL-1 domain
MFQGLLFDLLRFEFKCFDLSAQPYNRRVQRRVRGRERLKRPPRRPQRGHNFSLPGADGAGGLPHDSIRENDAMHCPGKGTEQDQIDVDAVFVLELQALLSNRGVGIHRERKRPKTGLALRHSSLHVDIRPPALDQPDIDIEQVQATAYCVINNIVDRLRARVEWYRRHHDRAILGRRQHAAQMACV